MGAEPHAAEQDWPGDWPGDWPEDWPGDWRENSSWPAAGGWTGGAFPEAALPDAALPHAVLPQAALPQAVLPQGAPSEAVEGSGEVGDEVGGQDRWNPVVVLGGSPDSPLFGSVGLPATEALSADEALTVAECAQRVAGWASAVRLRALARLEEALAQERLPRRDCQPVRFDGAEARALAVAEAAAATAVSEAAAARLLHDAADLAGAPSTRSWARSRTGRSPSSTRG